MKQKNAYIRKHLTISTIACALAFLSLCLLPLKSFAQTGDDAVKTLVEMGFENVGWTEDVSERVYVLQNTAYRLNGIGLGRAIDVIQKMGLPEKKPCRIVVLENNVPQISLSYQPVESDTLAKAAHRDWDVSYNLGETWRKAQKVKVKNSSLFKIDVVVYPELSLKNLVITQIYQVLFNLSPAIEVSLWKGMKLTAQMVVPIYNDGYPDIFKKARPGFMGLSQTLRLPYNTWGTLTIGHFSSERYGVDLKLSHKFVRDNRFGVEARVGYTGKAYWDGFNCYFNNPKDLTWSLGGSFYWPRYNVETNLKVEQYLLKEKGVRLDVIRHFRYASIGFYAMKAEGANANGGFRFQVALPPYKYKRKGHIPRVIPSNNMGMAYNAGNEQYYYKGYRASPGDNIMQANSFNPYFIKSEILVY